MRITALLTGLLLAGAAPVAAMTIGSSDFADGTAIAAPQIYPRCGGQNVSPQLSWQGAPAGTKSFVLTMIDVDVKPSGWSHWIVVDLPPGTASLARGFTALPDGAKALAGNFGDLAYDGPCPPPGSCRSRARRSACRAGSRADRSRRCRGRRCR